MTASLSSNFFVVMVSTDRCSASLANYFWLALDLSDILRGAQHSHRWGFNLQDYLKAVRQPVVMGSKSLVFAAYCLSICVRKSSQCKVFVNKVLILIGYRKGCHLEQNYQWKIYSNVSLPASHHIFSHFLPLGVFSGCNFSFWYHPAELFCCKSRCMDLVNTLFSWKNKNRLCFIFVRICVTLNMVNKETKQTVNVIFSLLVKTGFFWVEQRSLCDHVFNIPVSLPLIA